MLSGMAHPPDWVTLRIFLAAIELGSLSKAAERCGIAISAATKRLQDLEADHAVLLLERSARGVRPTPAGEALAHHAQSLLDLLRRSEDEMRAFAAGGRGSVRLHVSSSAMTGHGLAEMLARFARRQPGIRVELEERTSLAALEDLLEHRADLAIISGGSPPAELVAQPWRHDRLLAVLPANHPDAMREHMSFAELAAEALIGVLSGGSLALQLTRQAEQLGKPNAFRFAVQGTDAARHLVAAGLGVSVMPEGVVRPYEQLLGLKGVPLVDDWARRELAVVSRGEALLNAPTRLLRDHLLEAGGRSAATCSTTTTP